MKSGARVAAAIELLEELDGIWQRGGQTPADGMLALYYRHRRYIGSKDRREISRMVYGAVRNEAALRWRLEQAGLMLTPREVVLGGLVFLDGRGPEEIGELFSGQEYCPGPLDSEEADWVRIHERQPLLHTDMPEPVRFNYPDWMQPVLQDLFGDQLAEAMAALNAEASVDLRVNILKATREQVMAALVDDGMEPIPMPFAADGLRLLKRGALVATQAFRDGWFEIQDEGSQLVAELVQARPGEKGIDFCAGAGGKTLALSARMENRGQILAWDVAKARLKQMAPRLKRAGVSNVQTRVLKSERDSYLDEHAETADWVLLDAPCSGTGMWRRSPDLKRRTTQRNLDKVTEQQRQIIDSAARLVKSGGRLIYATCSILRQENENQINRFLATHPEFTVMPVKLPTGKGGEVPYLRLFPHRHHTDGFFGAVLVKGTA
ncbi:MAG: RsmB/NOP family class I SAM-dependent RNA methyltransferase [Verrucomicrobiota bacterium]|nr:RsmB/NOP family class I SAM-dependent RNA methyltransferase [Verrucomicrobiota bacterium]